MPWRWYSLAAIVVVLDLFSKKLAVDAFYEGERLNILPFFDLTLRYNTGAAFSFLADQPGWQVWFFGVIASVVSVVLAVWIARLPKDKLWELAGLSLVLGGALGNLYDRVTLGKVVDFILVYYQGSYFPAFNIADSAICIGAGILILDTFIHRDDSEKAKK